MFEVLDTSKLPLAERVAVLYEYSQRKKGDWRAYSDVMKHLDAALDLLEEADPKTWSPLQIRDLNEYITKLKKVVP